MAFDWLVLHEFTHSSFKASQISVLFMPNELYRFLMHCCKLNLRCESFSSWRHLSPLIILISPFYAMSSTIKHVFSRTNSELKTKGSLVAFLHRHYTVMHHLPKHFYFPGNCYPTVSSRKGKISSCLISFNIYFLPLHMHFTLPPFHYWEWKRDVIDMCIIIFVFLGHPVSTKIYQKSLILLATSCFWLDIKKVVSNLVFAVCSKLCLSQCIVIMLIVVEIQHIPSVPMCKSLI